jgi:hypothetical protein
LLQTWAIPDDEAAFTLMFVLEGFDPRNTFPTSRTYECCQLMTRAVVPPPIWSRDSTPDVYWYMSFYKVNEIHQ